jgi:transcriptional regulator with XRE-family HTH domain
MTTPEPEVSLLRIRAALRRRAEETSLREVAREVGMSHRGLSLLIKGARPQSRTHKKLAQWYAGVLRSDASTLEVGEALDVLMRGIPEESRSAARRRTVEFVTELYRELVGDPPEGIGHSEPID